MIEHFIFQTQLAVATAATTATAETVATWAKLSATNPKDEPHCFSLYSGPPSDSPQAAPISLIYQRNDPYTTYCPKEEEEVEKETMPSEPPHEEDVPKPPSPTSFSPLTTDPQAQTSALKNNPVQYTPELVTKTLKRLWNHGPKSLQFFKALSHHPTYAHSTAAFDHVIDIAARLRNYKAVDFVVEAATDDEASANIVTPRTLKSSRPLTMKRIWVRGSPSRTMMVPSVLEEETRRSHIALSS
ncbi:hypothetical protein Vadar_028005 [Vaccinium darrowii]|uniref:Uncharacterized protein n=1 Tax=Vaccinium darrowii TaxID=229202 RepID=A0ACB7ZN95_9ERIC|nr:hypothetical protein Vadar_028005 [Vaccinium darrowii]